MLDQPARDAGPESAGLHREGVAGAIRAMATAGQVPAPTGPHGGGRQEALRELQAEREERARVAALQRPRRATPDGERGGLGV